MTMSTEGTLEQQLKEQIDLQSSKLFPTDFFFSILPLLAINTSRMLKRENDMSMDEMAEV